MWRNTAPVKYYFTETINDIIDQSANICFDCKINLNETTASCWLQIRVYFSMHPFFWSLSQLTLSEKQGTYMYPELFTTLLQGMYTQKNIHTRIHTDGQFAVFN